MFYYYLLGACFFSNERQKEVILGGRRGGEELGAGEGEREILNQDTLCEGEKSIFNKSKKITKIRKNKKSIGLETPTPEVG